VAEHVLASKASQDLQVKVAQCYAAKVAKDEKPLTYASLDFRAD
jgi:hypothetical protein